MKVLIIIDSLGGGGAERSTQVLCDFLYEQGVSFQIVCLYFYPDGFHHEMIDKGYDIRFLGKKSFIGQVREIGELIKSGNFDLVHSILFKSNLRTRFAKLSTKFQHLESLVNTTYSQERKLDKKVNQKLLWVYKILDKYSARLFVDHFHSITNTVRKHYVDQLGLDPKKITVVYRGRKSIKLNSIKAKSSSEFILLNVARQDYQKGQIFLLQAMNQLKLQNENNIKLIILGVDGSMTSTLKDYVKENELQNMVDFAGFSNDVASFLGRADLFIFSSLFEGLGGALIEAQSAGLPIIANDLEVLREVAVDQKNALFVDIKDSSSVTQAILKLKNSSVLRSEFARNSLKNYEENFREEVSNREMFKLYKELC